MKVYSPFYLLLFCWVLCAGCGRPAPVGNPGDPGREIVFEYEDSGASSVELVGSFNGWKSGATPLVKLGGGKWRVSLRLPPGSYEYLFYVDGTVRKTDPESPRTVPDGFGQKNSLLIVE